MKPFLAITATLLLLGASFAQDDTPEPPEVGPARLDLNTARGDQSQRQTFSVPEAGSTITVDVAVTEGGSDRAGFDIVVDYDDTQVSFLTARAVDLFDGAFLMSKPLPGKVALTGLLLDGTTPRANGSVAHLTFTVLDGFPGESRISLESTMLGTALKIDTLQVGTRSSVVTLGGDIPVVVLDKPDFDQDGTVGFGDFIIFAAGFGSSSGDQSYNQVLDLDGSGDIGFGDFLVFAQAFGT